MPKYEVTVEVTASAIVCVSAPGEDIAKDFLEHDSFLDVNGEESWLDSIDWCSATVINTKLTTKGEPAVMLDADGEEG